MRHANIPVFIPHLGCPNQCVFCNQRSISGCQAFHIEDVKGQIDQALSTLTGEDACEIAFFGGSFTGIDRDLMCRLLELSEGYVRSGAVDSVRLSTRPDYISDEILEILSRYSVRTIELGLQSMDDAVLAASRRGHTAKDAEEACRMVKRAGFSLVGQMMTGLPGGTRENERMTAERLISLGVDAVRIYPTVVFYDTPLCRMAEEGSYLPLTVEEAVSRTADVLALFEDARIPCIRLGLCATEELADPTLVYAGPNHPALGELIMSECLYRRILQAAHGFSHPRAVLTVPRGRMSQAIGQHRSNLLRLREETGIFITRVREDACTGIPYLLPG